MPRGRCTDRLWERRADCARCAVRQIMAFSALPESAFTPLLEGIEHRIYNDACPLYGQGERGRHVFSIRRGWVSLSQREGADERRIVRMMGPGSMLGMELLLAGSSSYAHDATTFGEVDLCRIPVRTLEKLEREHPELYPALMQRAEEHIRRADQVILSFTNGRLRQRIEHVLLFLAHETAAPDGSFMMLSGADFAALVGSSEESISRVIADFKRQGRLIQRKDGRYACAGIGGAEKLAVVSIKPSA